MSEVPSEAAAGLLRKTSPGTFFTMLTFSQSLGVCEHGGARESQLMGRHLVNIGVTA